MTLPQCLEPEVRFGADWRPRVPWGASLVSAEALVRLVHFASETVRGLSRDA